MESRKQFAPCALCGGDVQYDGERFGAAGLLLFVPGAVLAGIGAAAVLVSLLLGNALWLCLLGGAVGFVGAVVGFCSLLFLRGPRYSCRSCRRVV